jgi:hypothetical protein
MLPEMSWTVRARQLAAVLATKRTAVVAKLCGLPDFVSMLAKWLMSAEVDSQTTFLRKLLEALGQLPVQGPALAQSGLLRAVARLQKYRQVALPASSLAKLESLYGWLGAVGLAQPLKLLYLRDALAMVCAVCVLVLLVHAWGAPCWSTPPTPTLKF